MSILDIQPQSIHQVNLLAFIYNSNKIQRAPIFLGSEEDVKELLEYLKRDAWTCWTEQQMTNMEKWYSSCLILFLFSKLFNFLRIWGNNNCLNMVMYNINQPKMYQLSTACALFIPSAYIYCSSSDSASSFYIFHLSAFNLNKTFLKYLMRL